MITKEEQNKYINFIIICISLLVLTLTPIIIHKKEFMSYSPIISENYFASGNIVEVFNYYKSKFVIFCSFTMFILFNYKIFFLKSNLKESKLNFILYFLYAVVLISSIISKYTSVAFFGNQDRFEGAITFISYLNIFFVLFNIEIKENYYKLYYLALIPFIIINFITSFSYINGFNLLENNLVNEFLGGGLQGELINTIYNENFGSALSALVFCVSLMNMLFQNDIYKKIFLLIIICISYITTLSMTSAVGFFSILLTLPFIILISVKLIEIKKIVVDLFMVFTINNIIFKIISFNNRKIYEESFGMIDNIKSYALIFIMIFLILLFLLNMNITKKRINLIMLISILLISSSFFIYSYLLKNYEEQIRNNDIYNKINIATTYRLDIWSRSIKILDDNLLFGNGLDTFPYDFIVKDSQNGIFSGNTYIDRPHNWYISIIHSIGILGFLCIFSVIIYIFKYILYSLIDKNKHYYSYVFFIGVLVYCIQSITNDSMISTSVFFWILSALSCNIICKK